MMILHLKHNKINYKRWDEAIAVSSCPMPYALSWFLDAVSPDWEALVTEDYTYVMPITVKKKFGLNYTVQPYFSQQLGIFSEKEITIDIIKTFLKKVPTLSYGLNLNEKNIYPLGEKRVTLIIDLNDNYQNIRAKFSQNTKRNISKAEKNSLRTERTIETKEFIEFLFKNNPHITATKNIVRKLIDSAIIHYNGFIELIKNNNDNIIAGAFFVDFNGRKIYLLPANDAEGKKKSAMFLLINELLKESANKKEILDFEGSMIEGVARFYRGFGGIERYYYAVNRYRPKWLLKWKN